MIRTLPPEADLPGAEAERGWLRRHAIVPRKRLGQSFLAQPQVADRLVRAMGLPADAAVMEIGAGAGALTRALLDAVARVWAVEVDPRLVRLLSERFAAPIRAGRVSVVAHDVLSLDPVSLPDRPTGPLFLAGNLPYAITTPILLWTIDHRTEFPAAAFLIQREVEERLTAPPGSRTYGSITVWMGYHATVARIARVDPGAFWPVPQVDSSLISIRFREEPPAGGADPAVLEKVLGAAFGQRRKMLRGSLAKLLGDETPRALAEAGIDPTRRAESLSVEEFVRLAQVVAGILR